MPSLGVDHSMQQLQQQHQLAAVAPTGPLQIAGPAQLKWPSPPSVPALLSRGHRGGCQRAGQETRVGPSPCRDCGVTWGNFVCTGRLEEWSGRLPQCFLRNTVTCASLATPFCASHRCRRGCGAEPLSVCGTGESCTGGTLAWPRDVKGAGALPADQTPAGKARGVEDPVFSMLAYVQREQSMVAVGQLCYIIPSSMERTMA